MLKFFSLHFNVQVRLLEQFLGTIAFNMVFPFMIIYFSGNFGEATTGVIYIFNIILGFIASLYGGYLADKYGRKKIMLWGESIRFAASLIMAFSISPWLNAPALAFFMMTINSACLGLVRPAGEAMIVDASTPEDRKYIYGLDYWLFNGSLFIGGLVGGFLFREYLFELLSIVALISLVSLLVLVFLIKETNTLQIKSSGEKKRKSVLREIVLNYKNVLKDKIFRIFVLAGLLEMAVQFQVMSYISIRLSKELEPQTLFSLLDYSLKVDGVIMFGILNSVNTLLIIMLGFFISKIIKNVSDKYSLRIGIVLYTFGFSVIAVSNQPWILIAAMILVAVGELIYIPIKQSLLADIIPDEQRGAYMATNGLTFRGATILGSLAVTIGAFLPSSIMGILFFLTGISSIFLYNFVIKKKEYINKVVVEVKHT